MLTVIISTIPTITGRKVALEELLVLCMLAEHISWLILRFLSHAGMTSYPYSHNNGKPIKARPLMSMEIAFPASGYAFGFT